MTVCTFKSEEMILGDPADEKPNQISCHGSVSSVAWAMWDMAKRSPKRFKMLKRQLLAKWFLLKVAKLQLSRQISSADLYRWSFCGYRRVTLGKTFS